MLPLDQTFTFRDQAVAWGTIGEGEPIILIHGFPWSAQACGVSRRISLASAKLTPLRPTSRRPSKPPADKR